MGLSVEVVVRKPPESLLPEKVAEIWAREWAKEGKKVDWQRLMPPKGFHVLPRRWVVERTFAHLRVDRPQPEDVQRLREAMRHRGGLRLCSHDAADGEAFSPCVGVSRQSLEGEFSEVRLQHPA